VLNKLENAWLAKPLSAFGGPREEVMNLITFESLTLQERGHARGGIFRYYELLHGREGAPDNFYLSIGVLAGDFVSPRHRHNFD
jgi:hypothetical protein